MDKWMAKFRKDDAPPVPFAIANSSSRSRAKILTRLLGLSDLPRAQADLKLGQSQDSYQPSWTQRFESTALCLKGNCHLQLLGLLPAQAFPRSPRMHLQLLELELLSAHAFPRSPRRAVAAHISALTVCPDPPCSWQLLLAEVGSVDGEASHNPRPQWKWTL